MSDFGNAMDPGGTPVRPDGLCGLLFDHWQELCAQAAGAIPVRAQIDMLTLPTKVLPWFFLHERDDGRFRNVIAGTKLVDGLGYEPKGRYLDEVIPQQMYRDRQAVFDACLGQHRVFYEEGVLANPTSRYVGFRRILLPLAQELGGAVNLLCGLIVFVEKAGMGAEERSRLASGHRGVVTASSFLLGAGWGPWPMPGTEAASA